MARCLKLTSQYNNYTIIMIIIIIMYKERNFRFMLIQVIRIYIAVIECNQDEYCFTS